MLMASPLIQRTEKSSIIYLALGNGRGYNMAEMDVLSSMLTQQSVVYVAGTHIGTLLVPLAVKTKQVVGIEANPDSFALLTDNIHLNGLHNVQIFNCALYHSEIVLTFHKGKANSGGSKIKPQHDIYSTDAETTEIAGIPARRLDDICRENDLPAADMLIMDIEGSEYAAMQGTPVFLQQCKMLYVEFQPHHLRNVSGVSAEDFFALIEPHFKSMQVMQDIVIDKNETFDMAGACKKVIELYNNDIPADLIFSKK